jgi:hypothetical protein
MEDRRNPGEASFRLIRSVVFDAPKREVYIGFICGEYRDAVVSTLSHKQAKN